MQLNPKSHYIVVTKSGHVFGATSIEATAKGFTTRLILPLQTLENHITADDLEVAYEVNPEHPAAQINPGILSTVTTLERLVAEFSKGKQPYVTTIFGSGSLSLTLLPDRSTDDLDTIASDAFAAFVNSKNLETDINVELLDERLFQLLGPWQTRTTDLYGPLGLKFRLVHPLDTVMQKLLRYSEAQFQSKDQADIDNILNRLFPSKETLLDLLTENPTRYARFPGHSATQADAVERNTRWFLNTYLPEISFEQLLEKVGDRIIEPATKAGFLPKREPIHFRAFLKEGRTIEP